MLQGRRVLLCVTGGVAAYKSAYLARRLIEAGAVVRVEMTDSALEFVGPQTFAAITGEHPFTSLFAADLVSPHTELARWADIVIVAPATAATIGRVANGISSDLVSSTLLATTAPVLLAPAMHTEMWEHPATRRNLELVTGFGYHLVGPNPGELAGRDTGIGRVAEPEEIVEAAGDILSGDGAGRRLLVTAGGTREPLDPVRFLGNRSSGKMGHSIADAAIRRGYEVTLVTTADLPVHPAVKVVRVETADEMLAAVSGTQPEIAVMAAAVADFKPAVSADEKIPRADGLDSVPLVPTPDILASLVGREPRPFVVGFAAETGGVERAIEKAKRKEVDLMVYNDVTEPGSGFGTDTNRVVLIGSEGDTEELPLLPKQEVAEKLLDRIGSAMG
ncbi:MAG TPA: bifunctional phosphopantothenoylcysteine decarboxylase/phosphopantothenate--cysteine ligase CoaBC, partial [Acidimicrobiia bacterium]|nr:bifunctional phosphopantothenoylcysteine decarboxylase/phosphopantothenate--cysteine ligase CoaBC [Acidimicrobiia bacterium]